MNASQARALAKQRSLIIDVQHRGIYVSIIDHIKGLLEKEECYATTYDVDIPGPVIKMLEEDGYKVISHTWRNETSFTISWKD